MKTSELREFLAGLGGPLGAVGVPAKSVADLRAVAHLLEPFRDLDLEQLADFLGRAAQARASGEGPAVAAPGLEETTGVTRKLTDSVLALRQAEPGQAAELEKQISDSRSHLQAAIGKLLSNFGFTASFKEDKKWLPNIAKDAAARREAERLRAETAKATATFQQILPRIESAESYQDEFVRTLVEELAAMRPDALKASAAELGASDITAGKKVDGKFVLTVLVKLTGIEAKAPRAPRKSKPAKEEPPAAPTEQVQAMVQSLKEMIDRTRDPNAVTDSEIDAILNRVSSEFPESQQKEIAKDVTGKGGRNGKAAIDNLRADLTAVKRALESQKV